MSVCLSVPLAFPTSNRFSVLKVTCTNETKLGRPGRIRTKPEKEKRHIRSEQQQVELELDGTGQRLSWDVFLVIWEKFIVYWQHRQPREEGPSFAIDNNRMNFLDALHARPWISMQIVDILDCSKYIYSLLCLATISDSPLFSTSFFIRSLHFLIFNVIGLVGESVFVYPIFSATIFLQLSSGR